MTSHSEDRRLILIKKEGVANVILYMVMWYRYPQTTTVSSENENLDGRSSGSREVDLYRELPFRYAPSRHNLTRNKIRRLGSVSQQKLTILNNCDLSNLSLNRSVLMPSHDLSA